MPDGPSVLATSVPARRTMGATGFGAPHDGATGFGGEHHFAELQHRVRSELPRQPRRGAGDGARRRTAGGAGGGVTAHPAAPTSSAVATSRAVPPAEALVRLQDWVVRNKLKVVVLFEGRDAAGKGGSSSASASA